MISELPIEYDDEFERHVVEFGSECSRSASEVIVYTVANISETDPTALRPLGEVIDPDALDTIFDQAETADRAPAHLSFEYEGFDVTLFSHGRLTISEAV